MKEINSKKNVLLYVLSILNEYSDSMHSLTIKNIVDLINEKYGLDVNRKTVKSHIETLNDAGFEILSDKYDRVKSNGETETLCTNYSIAREFTHSELRLLISCIIFSRHIPNRQARDLIRKLELL